LGGAILPVHTVGPIPVVATEISNEPPTIGAQAVRGQPKARSRNSPTIFMINQVV
jgi:hypothetical protein